MIDYIEKAKAFSMMAHKGQTDKAGEDYFTAHVAEWPMAAVQKTAGEKSPEGSNSSMSATASKIFDFSRGI